MKIITSREIVVESRLAELSNVCETLRNFCAACTQARLSETATSELELAVNEAMANIVKHAYEEREGETLRVVFEEAPDRVVVRLLDRGSSFEPSQVLPPKLDGTQEGGMGLFLISELMDEVQYSRTREGENQVTLAKRVVEASDH